MKRPEEWATWAREGSVVNTNMHLESFHRTLKREVFGGKHMSRVDELLSGLRNLATTLKWNHFHVFVYFYSKQ